MSEGGQVCG